FDEEALGAARKVAGHRIEAEAHHPDDVEPARDAVEQRLRPAIPRGEVEVARARVWDPAAPARRTRRGEVQLAGAVRVEQEALQRARLPDDAARHGPPLAVERP